ncbi:PREDICTED: uncharacterized protein LOC18607441 [Theobroma cacao]|uniref:Uncharacterized protein LOC18607441 n=1 Tax=Theobroma cacao TaxID=3641 RepID=A0AB32VR57_THECC|nr:PREDICTED: uncharacterized protein LOC18607441 [Theobroma cacao]
MLLTIALSLLYVEIKESVFKKIFTEIAKRFWSEWELRSMVVVSLILQFLLVYFARKRKKYRGKFVPAISISAWLIYLSADWMATLVLSTLLRGRTELENGFIVFWTPFLLWHLGSPYNITAYSIEDNELWLRHFFGMMFQVGEAIYIYVRFRSNTVLNALALPLFIAGVIKYGERIWALRCASKKQLINFFYSSSTSISGNESHVVGKENEMIRTGLFDLPGKRASIEDRSIPSEVKFLREANLSFDIFKPLFADLPFQISHKFHDEMVFLDSKSPDEAFNFVEIELSFLYDLLFTKNPIRYRRHRSGLILRGLCSLSVVSVLIVFSALLHKIKHSTVDTVVTYLLLSGAIYLEIYSFFMHFGSKWTMLRYAVPRDKRHKLYHGLVKKRLRSIVSWKGINKMAQHDLIDYCVKAKASRLTPVIKLIDTGDLLQKFGHAKWKPVDSDLKQFIYGHLKEKRTKFKNEGFQVEYLEKLLSEKGDSVIKEKGFHLEDEWKLESTDFTRRIVVWHIATGLVYYDDLYKHRGSRCDSILRIGKSLSDYMMYLVLVRPSMLPNGFSETVNKETYLQTQRFFAQTTAEKRLKASMKEFVSALISLHSGFQSNEIGALLDGIKFGKQLQDLVRYNRWDDEEKWKMINDVWMEMLVYAASRCTWEEHAQQLRHGGELLTHVSLLMAHHGLSTQVHRLEKSHDDQCDATPFPEPI